MYKPLDVVSALLFNQDSTGSFPDWIASFIRRVIQLLENLPEEGPNGSSGGPTEGMEGEVRPCSLWFNQS